MSPSKMLRRYKGASTDKALLMLNPVARWETPPAPILRKGGWAPGLDWTDVKKLNLSLPLEFAVWIAQPVPSRYTECPIPTPNTAP